MIILVVPMYSKQELNADSNYVVQTALINGMRRVRPDWHFVCLFPDNKSGFRYEPDGFFNNSNVSRVPIRISPRKMSNAVSYDGQYFDALFRQFAFDVVWSNLVEIAGHIRFAGERSFETKANPVVVAAHNYVIHESLPYPFETMQNVAAAQVMGAAIADWSVFNSDYCEWMFFDTARRWLNDSALSEIKAKSSRINYGTLDPELIYAPNHHETPIIAYNHRLQGYKNYKITFELFNELYQEGVRFRVKYMNNAAEHTSDIAHYPFVDIRLCATRPDYLRELRECDLNVTNSQHETFCISAIESMALGQPLVAPEAITFPEITGRDMLRYPYPYLFKTRAEQKEMLRRLLIDMDEREKWGRDLSEWVCREYGQTLWAQCYAELFERLTRFSFDTPTDTADMFINALQSNSGASMRDMYNAIVHTKIAGRQPFSNQSLTLVKLARMARNLGARIAIEDGEQRIYYPSERISNSD